MALPDRFAAVGLVDIVPEAFKGALEITGLPESACFESLSAAMATTPCDAVGVFTPAICTRPIWKKPSPPASM